jgi:hypothetical protein
MMRRATIFVAAMVAALSRTVPAGRPVELPSVVACRYVRKCSM